MRSVVVVTLSALLAGWASASLQANLNYASPSRRHGGLGIDVPLVQHRARKRSTVARDPSELNFTHGVASGDPWPQSVILWTRVAPSEESDEGTATVDGTAPLYNHETQRYIEADPNPICLEWAVFDSNPSDGTGEVVVGGEAYTTSDIDYTVKVRAPEHILSSTIGLMRCDQVEAEGLEPLTEYYYQFTVCGSSNKSPLGRTKTAPAPDDDVSELSFAVFSCSNYREYEIPQSSHLRTNRA